MPVEISTDDIKNVLACEKEEEIHMIRYIKGGKAISLVELVFQKECDKDHTAFDRNCEMYQEMWKKFTESTRDETISLRYDHKYCWSLRSLVYCYGTVYKRQLHKSYYDL